MTDPIQHSSSGIEWIKANKLEAYRRIVFWGALIGVLLYIYGEIGSHEPVVLVGIWILVASIGFALIYKVVSFLYEFFSG